MKRNFDVGAAFFALCFLSPLFLLIGCLVKIADGGPVFQCKSRIGSNGRTFQSLAFRTTSIPAAAPSVAMASQPRRQTTTVGSVLTELGLDQLPQLINVLRGDMSIVGPRPAAPGEFEIIELETGGNTAEIYPHSRPGSTGLWRLTAVGEDYQCPQHGHSECGPFLRDLRIITKTVAAVCSR
ncbi:sugar transferase [Sinorhizobium americanum]|nr:sugar transferase [Sinorhizobium americanum]